MTKILIIEDDYDISEVLKLQLQLKGYEATVTSSFDQASKLIEVDKFDLFLIDRMLPGISGIEICQKLKSNPEYSHIPLILITALGEPNNIIEGLDAGADDYITKPFDIDILQARVRSHLRRVTQDTQIKDIYTYAEISLDTRKCTVKLEDDLINLTHTEFQILQKLLEQPGIVQSRENLIRQILGGEVHVTNRTIDTHIAGLRKKMKFASNYIETIRGVGYRLKDYEA